MANGIREPHPAAVFVFHLSFMEQASMVQKKRENFVMRTLAVALMAAVLSVAHRVFAQMGSPDAPPPPGLPGVAGPLAAKYGADAARILKAAETDEDGYAALTYLCDHVGKRLSGTPQLNT